MVTKNECKYTKIHGKNVFESLFPKIQKKGVGILESVLGNTKIQKNAIF